MTTEAPHLELRMDDYPDLDPAVPTSNYANGNDSLQNAKRSFMSGAQSTVDAIQSSPLTQNITETVTQGPIAQSVKNQSAKTSSEFRDLANARTTPAQPAATGQPLTHYHSLFYRLLSWKNPRATAISYLTIVLLIFAARYLDVLRYTFKVLYIVLGVTTTLEVAGKMLIGNGLTSQIRPKRYFVIPRESLARLLEDVTQFINFFVIELQRIIFAENVYVTGAAFVGSFLSYWLIKWLPLWGLSLIGTSVLYLCPLIYIQNKEFIDSNLRNAGVIINQQAHQVKDLAVHHTGKASETVKIKAGEYSHKAQEILGSAKTTIASKAPGSRASSATFKKTDFPDRASSAAVQQNDFPVPPQTEPDYPAYVQVQPAPAIAEPGHVRVEPGDPLLA